MTRTEYRAAYQMAVEASEALERLHAYLRTCRHVNGFKRETERVELRVMELRIDLWNASQTPSRWDS